MTAGIRQARPRGPSRAARLPADATGRALVGLVGLGAALRLATLDVQSLWGDEAFTAQIVSAGLGEGLEQIPRTESTPPLYYLLAWIWARAFGVSEPGLRLLPALLGTLTVPAVYALGHALWSRRAGLVAAALTAVSPFMVWYSQEARCYALLALLSTVGLLCLVRALATGRRSWIAGWAAVSALSLATHYFAAITVAAEAVWLLARAPAALGIRAGAVGVVAIAQAALAPLLLYQREHVPRPWTSTFTVLDQTLATGQQFLVGLRWTWIIHRPGVLILGGACLLVVSLLLRRDAAAQRRAALLPASVAATGLVLPWAISLVGTNYLAPRNVIAVWPLLAVLVGLGADVAAARRWTAPVIAAVCALAGAITIAGALDERLQRDDWRGLFASLPAPAVAGRAVYVVDGFNHTPITRYYLPATRAAPAALPPVSELIVLGRPAQFPLPFAQPPAPGFARAALRPSGAIAIARYSAAAPVGLPAQPYGNPADAVLFEPPRPARR